MPLPSGSGRRARLFEAPLAALTLLLSWIGVETDWLPTWLDVGPVTLPPTSLYAVPLAVLAVAIAAVTYRRRGTVSLRRLAAAGLGALVVLTAANAVVVLNASSGGVFFAGVPPVLLGVLLSVLVLVNAAVAAGRRVAGSTA